MENTTPPERTHAVIVDGTSALANKILKIVKQDAEFIYVEVKQGADWIEAKFAHKQVALVTPDVIGQTGIPLASPKS